MTTHDSPPPVPGAERAAGLTPSKSEVSIWTGLALREWAETIADKIDAGEVWVTADLFHDGRVRDDVTFHVNKLTNMPELE